MIRNMGRKQIVCAFRIIGMEMLKVYTFMWEEFIKT